MILRDKINNAPGFQYVVDNLELMSSAGRRHLLQCPFSTDRAALETEYEHIQQLIDLLRNEHYVRPLNHIRHQLMQLNDIQATILHIKHHTTVDELELFEIKLLAFLSIETRKAAVSLHIEEILDIPDLSEVFHLLDPDDTGISHFYIYDSYDDQLALVRKSIKEKQSKLNNGLHVLSVGKEQSQEDLDLQRSIADLFQQQCDIQRLVEIRLSEQLFPFNDTLSKALERMAYTDVLLAKATLFSDWNLVKPVLASDNSNSQILYQGLFNPRLLHRNNSQNLRYQPIDISIHSGVCLVTGANMAGKTVLLKSLGIAQLMAQFGMFVPAFAAQLTLVDDVVFCIGDDQNEMNGLSSFASEVLKISATLQRSRNEKLLILIDEPARTTNPIEGKALVQALVELLNLQSSISVITTHYSQLNVQCHKLRVKGFDESLCNLTLSPENINSFIDYSLLETSDDDVPHDALRIANILQCDTELIAKAHEKLLHN